jgi:L-ascorbate metabolism protein UlaG (beta-lactamase superfamily)
MEGVLVKTFRNSGLNASKLRAMALEMGPIVWERYNQERRRIMLDAPHNPQPATWSDTGLHAAWLGHSTVLLKIDGITLLTDPVLGRRVGLNFGPLTLGLKRIVAPALKARELPRPDLILLSHAHMDHFDLPTLRILESPHTRIVTASKTIDLLRSEKYASVRELGWGEEARFGDLIIRAFQVKHWGARLRTDTFRGYNGYVIETPRYRVLFGGDTAMTDTFRTVRTSRAIDLAIMPIGAYNPWIHAHCDPEQALKMTEDAGADRILPVHHQTFNLSDEPYLEPIERLVNIVRDPSRLALTEIGQEFHFTR